MAKKNYGMTEDQVLILRKHYVYDNETGNLLPLKADCCTHLRMLRKSIGGKPQSNGYRYIVVGSHKMRPLYHRVVWALANGAIPPGMEIDHIDGNRDNNRIENLRMVTCSGNNENRRTPQTNNKLQLLGASLERRTGRYVATIRHDGKKVHIGTFSTPEEAHCAYIETKRRLHACCTL